MFNKMKCLPLPIFAQFFCLSLYLLFVLRQAWLFETNCSNTHDNFVVPSDRPSVDDCLASPWLNSTPEMKNKREKALFPIRKLKAQRTEYKMRLLALQTRVDMSLRRYSSTIELKSPGLPGSPKPKNGVVNSLVCPKIERWSSCVDQWAVRLDSSFRLRLFFCISATKNAPKLLAITRPINWS